VRQRTDRASIKPQDGAPIDTNLQCAVADKLERTDAPKSAMKSSISTVDTIMSALGVRLPAEFLPKLEIEEFLDQCGQLTALETDERQHLGEVLRAAENFGRRQSSAALGQAPGAHLNFSEPLAGQAALTARERAMIQDYQQHEHGIPMVSGKFALGNILVAKDEITRVQLEDALRRQSETGRRLGEELIQCGHVSAGQVEGGLRLQRKLIACALAIVVGLAPLPGLVPAAEAVQRSAAMPVSVTVIANAKLKSSYQATQIKVTAADVVRGYVEVPAASRFTVATNSRSGYLLEFHPVGNLVESVQVGGLGNAVQLGADGGIIVQRGIPSPNLTHELSFRFSLSPDTLPGNYPWPLALSVRALY
jgi:hypothetical protein